MYRHCIHCSADLGANEAVEAFPVGRTIAFDAAKGRLWAVCAGCGRWNLSPIEERWEVVEAAEKLFVDARLRVQKENIGVAKLADGTRLIRIGRAERGELAAWRYGERLVGRRKRHLLLGGATAVAAVAAFTAGMAVTSTSLGTGLLGYVVVHRALRARRENEVVHRVEGLHVLRKHVADAHLARAEDGGVELRLPHALDRWMHGPLLPRLERRTLVVRGPLARSVLGRALVHANAGGATHAQVHQAVERLAGAGTAEGFLDFVAGTEATLLNSGPSPRPVLSPESRLALEMALHEESERRALEGELSLLEAAWREAEEIAGIADGLASEQARRPAPATG
jgi:hypothetical protein